MSDPQTPPPAGWLDAKTKMVIDWLRQHLLGQAVPQDPGTTPPSLPPGDPSAVPGSVQSEMPPQAGRDVTGVPKSVETDRQLGRAGAVVGGAGVLAGAASALPGWVFVTLIVVVLLAVAGFAAYRWRRPATGKVA